MILRSPRHRSRRASKDVAGRARPCPCVPRAGRRRPARALAALLLVPLALGACTNSKLVIGPLYNRLDDRMQAEFEELADFDERQTALFEAAAGTAHVWHRRSELPAYARLTREIAASIARPGAIAPDDVTRWARTIERHAVALRECHPINFSLALMASLTDEQIDAIERHLESERRENRERRGSRTPEERMDYRLGNVRKWAGRIGVELTANQTAMLRTAFGRQVSLRNEYRFVSDRWNETLFELLREREAADFEARMRAHLGERWTLLEKGYPDQWRRNRELWRDTAHRLVESLSAEQRGKASGWLDTMGGTLAAISRDEPSFRVGDDPSVGCLADTAASGAGASGDEPIG